MTQRTGTFHFRPTSCLCSAHVALAVLLHSTSWGAAEDVPNGMQSRAQYHSPGQPWPRGKQEAIFSNGLGLTVSSEETAVASSTCRRSPRFPGNKVKMKFVKHELLCKVKPPAVKPGIRPWFWSVRQQRFCIQCKSTTTLPCLSMAVLRMNGTSFFQDACAAFMC